MLACLRDAPAYVPSLWPLELASALRNGERKKRISRKEIERGLEQIEHLDIRVVEETISILHLVRLASAWSLTVYDASYVQLASRLRVPLASLDQSMCDAAVRGSLDFFA